MAYNCSITDICSLHKLLMVFMLLSVAFPAPTEAIVWQTSSDAYWALSCDFVGKDIGSEVVSGQLCSSACSRTSGCTHFAWTLYNGGTCWYKSDRKVDKSQAISNTAPSSACGILRSTTKPVPKPAPKPAPKPDIVSEAKPYSPIFLYDGSAGSYCFPDDKRNKQRNGQCQPFSNTAPVFVVKKPCGKYNVFQFNLWYGWQKKCSYLGIGVGGSHDNDNEYVQVWTRKNDGHVEWVRYNQHNGWYFREVGKGAEIRDGRPVIYIGKVAHGAYHRRCTGNPFRSGTRKCLGGCAYWDDYRNPNGDYTLDSGTLVEDPSPRDIQCDAGLNNMCTPGHSSRRSVASSACYGVSN